jgi:hypothetical protein
MNILPGFKLCRKGLHQYPVKDKRCLECKKLYYKEWANSNRKKLNKRQREWKEANRNSYRQLSNNWRNKNIDKARKSTREWAKNNAHKRAALNMKRKAAKMFAIAPWADHEKIKALYKKAVELTRKTGVKHHVDHVYPLQSKYLCGLHVETNLQILTAKENIKKGNRSWPGQLDCQKE